MGLRRFERALVRSRCIAKDGHAGGFQKAWEKYQMAKYGSSKPNNTNHISRTRDVAGAQLVQRKRFLRKLTDAIRAKKEEQNPLIVSES